ncbi:MFS transporter (organic anion transporter) [Sarotherodon galilaeus]
MDSQQPLTEGLRRSSRDSRPPAHLQYDVQYPGSRSARCDTESQTECQHSDTDTHGLQDPDGESESQPETSPAPLPTNQDEVMRELLMTMGEIRQLMIQLSPPHSRSSSRSSIHTVSSDESKSSVCGLQAIPQTHQQHEQFPVIDPATCQSPSQPPQVSHHSGAVPAASPPFPNSTILDAAVPSSGLPRPVFPTPDETPFNFLATPLQGPHQISCVQPAVPLDEDPAQPLICIPEPRQHPPVKQQPATSDGLHAQKPSVPITASSGHPVSTRTHVYKLEGPSFPDLTSEDEIQYRLLRMALTNLLDPHETEHFKYHVLLDHLKVDQAKRLALAFSYAPDPYTQAIKALDERYGQPRQLALKELRNILELPPIRAGDGRTLDNFALRVQALVGLLSTMGDQGQTELNCGSHVDRLLEKLPAEHSSRFKRHIYREQGDMMYDLPLFSSWLQMECKCQPRKDSRVSSNQPRPARKYTSPLTTILHGTNPSDPVQAAQPIIMTKARCAYCCAPEHHISKCPEFINKTKDEKINWIKRNKRCWRCARTHQAAKCDLRKACASCMGRHLQILCEVNQRPRTEVNPVVRTLYFDKPSDCPSVLLKVVKVLLRNGKRTLETYAVLDDGSQRTMLLTSAAQHLYLTGKAEKLSLRTVHQEVETIQGSSVSFKISPIAHPEKTYTINNAFATSHLALSDHTYPVSSLQRRYKHLQGIPLPFINKAAPLLLIGSDHTHLITPIAPVRHGPFGSPSAVKTRLGWTLQSPITDFQPQSSSTHAQCLFTSSTSGSGELLQHILVSTDGSDFIQPPPTLPSAVPMSSPAVPLSPVPPPVAAIPPVVRAPPAPASPGPAPAKSRKLPPAPAKLPDGLQVWACSCIPRGWHLDLLCRHRWLHGQPPELSGLHCRPPGRPPNLY